MAGASGDNDQRKDDVEVIVPDVRARRVEFGSDFAELDPGHRGAVGPPELHHEAVEAVAHPLDDELGEDQGVGAGIPAGVAVGKKMGGEGERERERQTDRESERAREREKGGYIAGLPTIR